VISGFSTTYPHANPLPFLNLIFFKVFANGLPSVKFPPVQTSSYATGVKESLKNKTRITSYMRASFVDLYCRNRSQPEVATRLHLKVWWCTSEACEKLRLLLVPVHQLSWYLPATALVQNNSRFLELIRFVLRPLELLWKGRLPVHVVHLFVFQPSKISDCSQQCST